MIHDNGILWGLLLWVFIIIPGLIAGVFYLLYKFAKLVRSLMTPKNENDETQD